jgi:hypothetical protein
MTANTCSENDITKVVDKAIAESGASSMQDMGKLMGLLKAQLAGKADMGVLPLNGTMMVMCPNTGYRGKNNHCKCSANCCMH